MILIMMFGKLKTLAVLEKATPLELDTPTVAKSIEEDMKALASGQAEIRNLQKLSLFSTSHPISLPVGADPKDIAEEKGVWEEDRLFARVFEGLMAFLDPTRVSPHPCNAVSSPHSFRT